MALADPDIEAVAIATPPHTHYELVRKALEAGKQVLVEKPLARTAGEAAELVALSEELGQVLMPGHTFLYSPSVNKVKELIDEDVLGEVYFATSSRMNLGLYQQDGVVLDLAPHDLSILLYWLGKPLVEVSANGRSVFQDGVHETAFMTLQLRGRRPGQRPGLLAGAAQDAADGRRRLASAWSSTTTPPPTTRSASTTAASTSPSRPPTSASTGSPTAPAT